MIFTLWCLVMHSKPTRFVGLTSLFFKLLSPQYSHARPKAASQFLAPDFFHHGQGFCIWQGTSTRRDYHERCPVHKYNACPLTNQVMEHNPLMAHLMPPILLNMPKNDLAFIITLYLACSCGG